MPGLFRHYRKTVIIVIASLAVFLSFGVPALVHSSQLPRIGQHHIDATSSRAAFVFGYKPGFNPRTGGNVTIYGNGEVSARSPAVSNTQGSRLTRSTLNALLRLAEAESFFSLPQSIVPKHPVADTSVAFITIHTTSQDRTVSKDILAHNAQFAQLFAVLSAAAGSPN